MTLDAGNEQPVSISLRVLDKVRRSLLSWDGNKRDTLISRLEPNDLGSLDGATGFVSTVTLALATLSFLLLFGRSRRGTQQTQSTREELAGHTLNNSDDVAGELRLDFIGDPVGIDQYMNEVF